MSNIMVRHNNHNFSKSIKDTTWYGLYGTNRSNTVAVDDFGNHSDWVVRLQDNPRIFSDPSAFAFKVKIGLSVVNHECGDQFIRKEGFKRATEELVEVE